MSHWKQAEIVTSLRHKVTAAAVSDRRSSRVHTSINRPGTVTDIRPWQRHINPIIALANRSFLQDDVRTSGLESEGRSLRNMKGFCIRSVGTEAWNNPEGTPGSSAAIIPPRPIFRFSSSSTLRGRPNPRRADCNIELSAWRTRGASGGHILLKHSLALVQTWMPFLHMLICMTA